MAIDRKDVPVEHRWNIEALYSSFDAWYTDLEAFKEAYQVPHYTSITKYKGTLSKSTENLRSALHAASSASMRLERLYCYAKLRMQEDLANHEAKQAEGIITSLQHEYLQTTNWLEHEILALPRDEILAGIEACKEHAFYLQKLIREKEHRLDPNAEKIVMLASPALGQPGRIFSTLNNADFRFDTVSDSSGQVFELTHASYSGFIASPDRTLRKNAFLNKQKKFLEYENSLTELLAAQVHSHHFFAKAHNFSSCLQAALYPKKIDTAVYHGLIQRVHERIESLHRYVALRKKLLGLSELHYYDLTAPLAPDHRKEFSFDEAVEAVLEAVKPLGTEYVQTLQKGLTEDRWVDRFENTNKRSGAFSSGCFDSMPYILMNFSGNIPSVKTLAHEAGHSMHTYLSCKQQPYETHSYDIFVAEVASTLNEELLFKHLIERAQNKEEKASLIASHLEHIVGVFFRQTCFAEFELFIHEAVEKNIPLTAKLLKDKYRELIQFYYGPELVCDEEVSIEWARIPHFYSNFYVFQYATGFSSATCLHRRIQTEGQVAVSDYLEFLRSGGSVFPQDLLEKAKVDVQTGAFVDSAIDAFDAYVQELKNCIG